jgi:Bacterial regulatory proteins, tetR family
VLTAARSLFGRRGYAQTSVDEIADAARVTNGAVYHNFDGKEALFRAVHAEMDPSTVATPSSNSSGRKCGDRVLRVATVTGDNDSDDHEGRRCD